MKLKEVLTAKELFDTQLLELGFTRVVFFKEYVVEVKKNVYITVVCKGVQQYDYVFTAMIERYGGYRDTVTYKIIADTVSAKELLIILKRTLNHFQNGTYDTTYKRK